MRNRALPTLLAALFLWWSAAPAAAQVVGQIPRSPSWQFVPPSPGQDYGWVGGHWRWNGVRYAWIAGHYERRPFPGAHWISGHWQRVSRGWQYVKGYWSSDTLSKTVDRI